MSNEYQKELFNEFSKKKGRIEKIARKITKKQLKLYVTVSLENIVLFSIIAIMLIIVSFAFGVERGKKVQPDLVYEDIEPVKVAKEAVLEKEKTEVLPEAPKKKVYTVQLISYKKKERAEKEKKKLIKKGFEAFIVKSGNWHQICVGGYADIKEAEKAKKQFVSGYKGCFIKKIIGGVQNGTTSEFTFKRKR